MWTDGNGNFVFGDSPGPAWHTPSNSEMVVYATKQLTQTKSSQGNDIRQGCTEYIQSTPFQSNALGSSHNYDCRDIDQLNILVRLEITEDNTSTQSIWASDGTSYVMTPHTHAQLIQVVSDMNAFILSAQNRCAVFIGQVTAVDIPSYTDITLDEINTAVAQIKSIVWQ